jgi:hypothetical protein
LYGGDLAEQVLTHLPILARRARPADLFGRPFSELVLPA